MGCRKAEKGRVGIVEGESKRLFGGFGGWELLSESWWICAWMMADDKSTLGPVAAA